MAITINDAPANYSPVYGPNLYIVTSPSSSESNYSFVAQVFESGSNEFIGELKSNPHPVQDYGKFDVSGLIQSYLHEVIDFDDNVYSAKEIVGEFVIQFGEQYIDATGSFQRTLNSNSNTRQFFNASPYYREFVDIKTKATIGEHPYLITAASDTWDKYPLTSRRNIETARGTKQWLTYMPDVYTNVDRLEVDDLDGITINNIYVPTALENATDGKAYTFRVDPEAIESQTSFSGLQNYRVRTKNFISGATSSWTYINVMDCARWDLYSLYYLNRFGGIDSFSFNGRHTETINSRRKSYNTIQQSVGEGGLVNMNEKIHSKRDYYVNYNNQFQLTSGWIKESTQTSATDLQTSPVVWMEDPDGIILPVNIVQDTLTIDNKRDGVISVTMIVEYDQPIDRQSV